MGSSAVQPVAKNLENYWRMAGLYCNIRRPKKVVQCPRIMAARTLESDIVSAVISREWSQTGGKNLDSPSDLHLPAPIKEGAAALVVVFLPQETLWRYSLLPWRALPPKSLSYFAVFRNMKGTKISCYRTVFYDTVKYLKC